MSINRRFPQKVLADLQVNKERLASAAYPGKKASITLAVAALSIGYLILQPVYAEEAADTSNQAKVDGYFRSYLWSNDNFYFSGANNTALAIGGKLHAQTGQYDGFSAGASVYTSHAPFNNSTNIDPTLGQNVDTLGEAYVDYKNKKVEIKAGRQSLDTPFANDADYRMVPALYGGVTAVVKPTDNLSITGARITDFKGWTQSGFSQTNNYTNGPFATTSPFTTSGFSTVGIKDTLPLSTAKLESQGWYYRFNDIANLGFLDEKLSMTNGKTFNPFFGMQFVREKSAGAARLGNVDSRLVGATIGTTFPKGSLSAGVVHIPAQTDAVNNGGLISPYTHGFGSAALYTANLLFATEDQGSGNAYILHGDYQFTPQLSGWAAYNQFNMQTSAAPSGIIREYTASATYAFPQHKGLKLTDLLVAGKNSQVSKAFWQNRLLLQYDF
jgi:hypothetical protein